MTEQQLTMPEIHARLLEMAKTVSDILTRGGVPHFITFGTLLGAVRHGGFIPWDDDFDFFLFAESYAEATRLLRAELPEDMVLEDAESEPLYFHAWAHVKDRGTVALCDHYPDDSIYREKGLCIDLYLCRWMPEEELDLWRLEEDLEYRRRKAALGLISPEQLARFEADRGPKIAAERKRLAERRKNRLEITERADGCGGTAAADMEAEPEQVKMVFGMLLNERIMFEEEVLPLKPYAFEDTVFPGPADADALLKRFYGDYMQLPSPEGRRPHYTSVTRKDLAAEK